jgi:hypothetical protein
VFGIGLRLSPYPPLSFEEFFPMHIEVQGLIYSVAKVFGNGECVGFFGFYRTPRFRNVDVILVGHI